MKTKDWKEKKRNDLKYEANKFVYDFQKFQTIRSFGDSICNVKITTSKVDKKQSNWLESIF